MFDRYKENSDRFHSFLTTLAAIRMPQKISEYVGSYKEKKKRGQGAALALMITQIM